MKRTIKVKGMCYLLRLRYDVHDYQLAQRFYHFHRTAQHTLIPWLSQRREEAYETRTACWDAQREALQ